MRKILYGATMVLALAWISGQAAELPSLPAQAQARQPTLDDRLATGLYIQPGLALPDPLSRTLASLGLARPCGFSATAGE